MWNKYLSLGIQQDIMGISVIWYHLYNLKNVKNTHRGVLLLLQLY